MTAYLAPTSSSQRVDTPMPFFIVSPSEAFLIGCSVGEYLEAKRDNDYANILYFLSKRLRPFVPILTTPTISDISEDECASADIDWTAISEGEQIGICASEPNCFFHRRGDRIEKTVWDCSRNSLLDLLGKLVLSQANSGGLLGSVREITRNPPAFCGV
jgi:hypothetical protein